MQLTSFELAVITYALKHADLDAVAQDVDFAVRYNVVEGQDLKATRSQLMVTFAHLAINGDALLHQLPDPVPERYKRKLIM